MVRNFRTYLFLVLLSLMLGACVGPPKDDKCIPSDGNKAPTQTNSPGTSTGSNGQASTAEEIDKFIRDSKIITTIIAEIKDKLIGDGGFGSQSSAQGIFEGFINSPQYQSAIYAAFALFITLYGLGIVTGMVQASLTDGVIRVMKISFVTILCINWDTFYGTIGTFFIDGTDELISYFMKNFEDLYNNGSSSPVTGGTSDTYDIFARYDDFVSRVFSFHTFAFVSALFNMKGAGPYAPVYGGFLIMALWWVLQSVLKVVTVYIFSLFAKALLFAVAPIFLAFLLFNQTKPMFDAWLKQLVSFSLQPILIVAYVGLFDKLLTPFFDEFMQYRLCWDKLDNTTNDYGWIFTDPQTGRPADFGANSPAPISLQATILFTFFAWLFYSSLQITDSIVTAIVQSGAGSLSQINAIRNLSQLGAGGENTGKALGGIFGGGGR